MVEKIQVAIDVIVHATEDIKKILYAFEEMFELEEENFNMQKTTGHFDNPITILNAKIVKEQAQKFIEKIIKYMSKSQIEQIIEEIEERTIDSRLHIRIGKQEMIRGDLVFVQKDPIKIKIYTPIYNKKDTVKKFTEILRSQLD